MIKLKWAAALLLIVNLNSFAQFQLTNWATFTSMHHVIAACEDSRGRIWAATDGGVFIYDKSMDTYKEIRNIEGLLNINVTAIQSDIPNRSVYIGTSDGVIHIVTENLEWEYLTDIKMADLPSKQVNDFKISGNKAYIAGDFGLTILDIRNKVFIETATRLGTFQPNTKIYEILIDNDFIWAATNAGLAKANINSSISIPDSWTNYSQLNGITETPIISLAKFHNELYFSSQKHLFKLIREPKDSIIAYDQNIASWDIIKKLCVNKNHLFTITKFYLIDFINMNSIPYGFLYKTNLEGAINYYPSLLDSFNDTTLVLLTNGKGIGIPDLSDSLSFKFPNCPANNSFNSLSVAPDGRLWAASSVSSSAGIYSYYNNNWTNINFENHPELKSDGYFKISANQSGIAIASSWGAGFIIINVENDTLNLKHYDQSNSPAKGIPEVDTFVVIGESATDRFGTIWITNFAESNTPLLVAMDRSGKFYSYNYCSSTSGRLNIALAIDNSGTKWLGNFSGGPLVYFNDMGTLEDQSDDNCGIISSSNSALPGDHQNSLAVDHSGYLWIGTNAGLAVILNPSSVLTNAKPIVRKVNLMGSTAINSIMVDALDNKWLATNNGIWVLNSDATVVLANITTSNSPLIDNNVLSIATNAATGEIYFGTQSGLSRVSSLSITPNSAYNISCYPQPYNPSSDGNLVIEGLAADSYLFITSVSGVLVKSLTAQGAKTIWDGTDRFGNLVSSGVYLIIASSASNDAKAVGKFTVVRK
jgi:hypothetical protein